MARPDKVAAVEEIAEKFRGASASVVTEYRGLTMSQLTTLRRSLGIARLPVAKKPVKRAAEDAGSDRRAARRPTAITSSPRARDAARPADFAKANRLVIKGGLWRAVTFRCHQSPTESRGACCPSWPAR